MSQVRLGMADFGDAMQVAAAQASSSRGTRVTSITPTEALEALF